MKDKIVLAYIVFFAVGFTLLGLGVDLNPWFIVGLFVFTLIYWLWMENHFRCPKCKQTVFANRFRFFGIELSGYTPLPPDKCRKCGAKLE